MSEGDSRFRLFLDRYLIVLMRYRGVFRAAPAVAVLVGLIVVLGIASLVPQVVRTRYLSAARDAVDEGKLDLAKVYYGRLMEQGESVDPQDDMNWAAILMRNGEFAAANRIIDRLAPEDEAGYPPAHRLKAMRLAANNSSGNAPKKLAELQWHLKNLGEDRSADAHKLWAAFYFGVGQKQNALERLTMASEVEPDLWFNLSVVAKRLDENELYDTALVNAENHFRQALKVDPFDANRRIMLGLVLLEAKRPGEAGVVIDQGLALQDTRDLHRAAADVLLYRFDQIANETQLDFTTCNQLLSDAFKHAPNYPQVYTRLMSLYQRLDNDDQRLAMRTSLEELMVDGRETPFAHFSLGSIDWLENNIDSALWHLEKAYELDPNLLEVANNLAWVLAASETPDLTRAVELAESVVKRAPDQVRFRDTLATIYMKQERWDEALVEFERILAKTTNKKKVHENLASIYDSLGRSTLADLHRRRAAQEEAKAAEATDES